jgi:16S rRNA A1518/A1519 N6-dimethyltransferase RsmA/KsgA/DIM1 with predicted DNA glycosylase/AP lyase activity
MDIRQDSLADIKHDFLQWDTSIDYDLIITNPPFAIAEEITRKALSLVDSESGKVIMLQRLNWLGSASRDDFFTQYPPLSYCHAR